MTTPSAPAGLLALSSLPRSSEVVLPGNLLPPADSDFISPLTGNWAANLNCGAPGLSYLRSFSGGASLAMTATANGNARLLYSPYLPCSYGLGYDYSAYSLATSAGRTGKLIANFYDGSHTFISNTIFTLGLLNNAWTPMAEAVAPPSAAAVFWRLLWEVDGMTAGEIAYLDLVYAARTAVQVLVAWPTEPLSTSPLFADMTPFTRADQPLSMFHGRADNITDVQPGTLSLTMSDDLGWLTPQNPASPYYPNIKIGRRIQVNLPDETGTFHTRFDGQVNDLELTPAPTGLTADLLVQAADVIAYLNRQDPLNPWTKEEIFLDGPALHWTLDDPAGSAVATETSGNNGPPLQLASYGLGGSYAFAGGTAVTAGRENGMESQTWQAIGTAAAFPSAYFHQSMGGGTPAAQQNWQLQAPIAPVGTGTGQNSTFEIFLIPDVPNASAYTSATGYTFYAAALSSTRTGAMLAFSVTNGGGPTAVINAVMWSNFRVGAAVSFSLVLGPAWHGATPGPVAVAVVITGSNSAPTAKFYVGGALQAGTLSLPAGTTFNQVSAGGPLGGYQGWLGQLSCMSLYTHAVSAARLAQHAAAASSGYYGIQAGTVVSAVAAYAGLPPFWNNLLPLTGLSYLEYFGLQGMTALAAMQMCGQADGGLPYADAAGRLNYAGRETRMGAGGPSLTLQAGQYETDLGYKVNDQYLSNEAAYASAGIAAGTAAVNPQSQLDYGDYAPNGSAASPVSVPLLTYNGWYQGYLNGPGRVTGAFSPDNLTWAAQWAANALAQPAMRGSSVRIDMLTLPVSGPDGIPPSQLYALDIGSVIALAELPAQFPSAPHANEYFCEGFTETVQLGVHDLVINTSPASQGRAWIPGDPVYGQLDSTALIGRSSPAFPPVTPASEFSGPLNPGPPYYPPSYSSAMNKTGFVGDLDQAGIWANLAQQLQPPMCATAVAQSAQSIPNGAGPPGTRLTWDTVYADTLMGAGWLAGFPNWYFTLVPGWWQLHAVANFATNGTGRRAAWFLVGQAATRGGTGPVSGLNIVSPAETSGNPSYPAAVQISAKIYCALGTAIAVQCWQTSGGALNTAVTRGGCLFSARFLGDTATQD